MKWGAEECSFIPLETEKIFQTHGPSQLAYSTLPLVHSTNRSQRGLGLRDGLRRRGNRRRVSGFASCWASQPGSRGQKRGRIIVKRIWLNPLESHEVRHARSMHLWTLSVDPHWAWSQEPKGLWTVQAGISSGPLSFSTGLDRVWP